jgi:predicted ATP-dependent serine protease
MFDTALAPTTHLKRRGRPPKISIQLQEPTVIDFGNLETLAELDIDPRMLETMRSSLAIDVLISHEQGTPCATNIMVIGDPGVGKTTVMLDLISSIQLNNPELKILFISGEMGKKQMFKYTQRFKQFGVLKTLFTSDYSDHNPKDMIEQVLNMGWDLVLIDSIAEVIGDVRDENGWDRKQAESWLVDVCRQNNNGDNDGSRFTSFLLIQQVTKGGVFVGSNKLKHLVDASMEMRRESERDGGSSYMMFNKNRDGQVGVKMYFDIQTSRMIYTPVTITLEEESVEEQE